jgi:hypothetical protein
MHMTRIAIGESIRKKKVLDVIHLANGWILLKTENSKSERDFRVKAVFQTQPRIRSFTPKHAHFAIDFYGKLCADEKKAMGVFSAVISVWGWKKVAGAISIFSGSIRSPRV